MRLPTFLLKLAALTLTASVPIAAHLFMRTAQTKSHEPTPTPASAAAPAINFPPGFDYPQPAPTVERWVRTRDEARAREHGWYLWAGLNKTPFHNTPVWRTWRTSTQAFAPPSNLLGAQARSTAEMMRKRAAPLNELRQQDSLGGAATPAATAEPITFPQTPGYPVPSAVKSKFPPRLYSRCYDKNLNLRDGPTYQNNGDVMVAGVIYNDDAYNWIRGTGGTDKLYLASVLQSLLPKTSGGITHMPAMPPGSIVLKPMMWPVKATGYTALPVWDDKKNDNDMYAGFEIQSMWNRAVAVTPQPQPQISSVNVTYLYGVNDGGKPAKPLGPNTYQNAQVVPVKDFYFFRPNIKGMDACDQAILDSSFYWATGRLFQQGDYLVVIAMHIQTKEQPDWTFQSVWWSDRPNEGPYAANRPRDLKSKATGPWDHYLMTSTYGITTQPNGNKWPIAYNPYIELAAGHPIATNCMNCHHRAAWPGFEVTAPVNASYEAPGGPGPLDVFDMENQVFDGLLTLDSMWAISDRALLSPANARPPARGRR